MDSNTCIDKRIIWDIELGSLVKVKKTHIDGTSFYHHGIVIGEKQFCQLEMFPFVRIYTFETQTITQQYPSSIEVISRPSDDIQNKTFKNLQIGN